MKIGEIASAAAGNQDFFADARGALQHRNAPSALAGFDGAHQPRSAAAENHCIVVLALFSDSFEEIARQPARYHAALAR